VRISYITSGGWAGSIRSFPHSIKLKVSRAEY
jgi:hypothetical protein